MLEELLLTAPKLKVSASPSSPLHGRRYVHVHAEGAWDGELGDALLLVDEDWFGAQLGGVGVAARMNDDWEPPEGWPPPAPPPQPGTRNVFLKAPFPSGQHMRAGGLGFDIDWTSLSGEGAEAILQLLGTAIIRFDKCGPGVPGWYYNTGPTHTGPDVFAIDFMDGYGPIGCAETYVFGEVCVPNPVGPILSIAEILESLIDMAFDDLNWDAAAYGDPIRAAAPGVVLGASNAYHDGSSSDYNYVHLGVWGNGRAPTSAVAFVTAGSSSYIGPTTSLGAALQRSGADFWLRHLHLSEHSVLPSAGMWVLRGTEIGEMDDTGNSFTSHLHFSLRERAGAENLTSDPALWRPRRPMLEGHLMEHSDNGRCVSSSNKLETPPDRDSDGVHDGDDNCVTAANPDQADADRDGIGDRCSDDRDNDTIPNHLDSCPDSAGPAITVCAPAPCHLAEEDGDGDGVGDSCDPDRDGDGVANTADQCDGSPDSEDQDGDALPDRCDPDRDGDAWTDNCEKTETCGCMPDLYPLDPTRAGDPDLDGIDSLTDACACGLICFDNPDRVEDLISGLTSAGIDAGTPGVLGPW
jgi:hypothetical protein